MARLHFGSCFPSHSHSEDATVLPQQVKRVGPKTHHPNTLLPEFDGVGIGATDFVRAAEPNL